MFGNAESCSGRGTYYWNTANVENMQGTFSGSRLSTNIRTWNTARVSDM